MKTQNISMLRKLTVLTSIEVITLLGRNKGGRTKAQRCKARLGPQDQVKSKRPKIRKHHTHLTPKNKQKGLGGGKLRRRESGSTHLIPKEQSRKKDMKCWKIGDTEFRYGVSHRYPTGSHILNNLFYSRKVRRPYYIV